MKILHISTYDRGGAFLAAYRMHLALLEKGVDSKIIVLFQHNKDLKEVYGFLNNQNLIQKIKLSFLFRFYELLKMGLLFGKTNNQFNFHFSPYNIWKHSMVADADIIHLQWVAKFINYSTFFSVQSKPVIWTLHDLHPFSGGYHYDYYLLFSKKYLSRLNRWVENTKNNSVKLSNNLSIVSPSKWLCDLSKRSKTFSRFNHFVIPNVIDTNIFRPINKTSARNLLKLDESKKIILFLADSLSDPRKGLDDFRKVITILSDDFLVLTVGNGNLGFNSIENHSMGFVNNEEIMANIYCASDLLVTCSLEDNYPNTILESIACGTPVIGYDVGGISEIVESGTNGFLVKKHDYDSLASRIKILLSNETLLRDLQNSSQSFASKFSSELHSKNLIDLYKSLM